MDAAFGGGATGEKMIRGLKTTAIKEHPFGLELPRLNSLSRPYEIMYVGSPGYTDVSVSGITRLVGLYLGEWGEHHTDTIRHLRTIYAGGEEYGHDVYYEIGTVMRLFISGGCTDCSGGGHDGKERMDSVMLCLSAMYGIPMQRVDIPTRQAESQGMVAKFLEHSGESYEHEHSLMGKHTFARGQKIRFIKDADDYLSRPYPEEYATRTALTVEGIEDIIDRCTCGLGHQVHSHLHPENCLLRFRNLQGHHQMVHVQIGGKLKRYSGLFFEPALSVIPHR